MLAIIVVASLAVAGGAAAATGMLSAGDVIPPNDQSVVPDQRLAVEELVLATGTAPVAGPWQMTAYTSQASVGQPAGLPCVRLILTDPPADTPLAGSGFCGEVDDGFGAVSLPVVNRSGAAELLVFGIAPRGTARVELTSAKGGVTQTDAPSGGPRFVGDDVFVMAVPPGPEDGELTAADEGGSAVARKIDARGFFDRMKAAQALAD